MPYGTANVDIIQSSVANTPVQFNDGNGTQVGTLCRAWVQFAGASGTIASSFNVSSITRTSTGTFTINFTTALPDNKYSVTGSCGSGNNAGGVMIGNYQGVPSTSVCYVSTFSFTPAVTDYAYTSVAVFR